MQPGQLPSLSGFTKFMSAVSGVVVTAQCQNCGKIADQPLIEMIIRLTIGKDSHSIMALCRNTTECEARKAQVLKDADKQHGPLRSDRRKGSTDTYAS